MHEIMSKYNAGEITREQANEELKEYGISLLPLTEEERHDKKVREDAEGFFNPEDMGFERKPTYPKRPDMSRRMDLAGKTVKQMTTAGEFAVTYDEDGYAVESLRVGGVQA